MPNPSVQLITYPDSLGGDLKSIQQLLDHELHGLFDGGIHILPPFPSSGDRGFATITYDEIDSSHGSWEDIQSIANQYPVILDLMVNHVSKDSKYFQDILKNGSQSEYIDMFIPIEKYWPDGTPDSEDIEKIFLRRNEPFSVYQIESTGETLKVWTTFGKTNPSEQIDIDINSEKTKQFFRDVFSKFSQYGVSYIRLDAIGYVIKKIGTSCFWQEPEILAFLDWIREESKKYHLDILPEVHGHYSIHDSLIHHNYKTYDFVLPYLVLSALMHQRPAELRRYLQERSSNMVTMLDCHDGVPVTPDLDDIIPSTEAKKTVDICVERGSNLSLVFSEKYCSNDGFNVHQIRGTYYSMLNEDDDSYVAARAIQLFIPGIHQIYYVGLLAGKNDVEEINETGDGREINRHNYSMEELKVALDQKVVKRLLTLIRFRNSHPSFNGAFSVLESSAHEIKLQWIYKDDSSSIVIDFKTFECKIVYTDQAQNDQTFIA